MKQAKNFKKIGKKKKGKEEQKICTAKTSAMSMQCRYEMQTRIETA
jgi:hypothetical protein